MPPVSGTVVGGAIVPTDSADTYPVTDPQWGKGGAQFKTTTANRNAISVARLEKGMLVFCEDTGITYRLKNTWAGGVTTDADWEAAVGAGGGITWSGNPESVAYWQTSTTLVSNIFFTRSNATSIVSNNVGFTADYNTATQRYISTTGNDSNTGVSALSPWLTPQHAVRQCQLAGPGKYVINCAAGTYTSVNFDAPEVISRSSESGGEETVIQFLGDTTTPSNVVFSNNSTAMIYHSARNTTLQLSGIRFTGSTSLTCINHSAGKLVVDHCETNSFFAFINSSGPTCDVTIRDGLVLTSTINTIFAKAGCVVRPSGTITQTSPNPAVSDPCMFSIMGAFFLNGGGTYTLNSVALSETGSLMDANNALISFGGFSSYTANDTRTLFTGNYSSNFTVGSLCTFTANSTTTIFELGSDSVLQDNATSSWVVNSTPPGGISLSGGAHFHSDIILQVGILLTDYLVSYVQYTDDPEAIEAFAYDDRYTEKYSVSTPGNLPQGYSQANLSPQGFQDQPYNIYIAEHHCELTQIRVVTRVSNGVGVTDNYRVCVNGTPSALQVNVTNASSGAANDKILIAEGDRISVQVTSDAATVAEDITVQVLLRVVNRN